MQVTHLPGEFKSKLESLPSSAYSDYEHRSYQKSGENNMNDCKYIC